MNSDNTTIRTTAASASDRAVPGSMSSPADSALRHTFHPKQATAAGRNCRNRQSGRRRQPRDSGQPRCPRWYWVWTYNREHVFVRAFTARQAREVIRAEAAALEAADPNDDWSDLAPKGCHSVSRDLALALDLGLLPPNRVRRAPGVAEADAEREHLAEESVPNDVDLDPDGPRCAGDQEAHGNG